MSPWEKLLQKPHARGHLVQLYRDDEPSLVRNVSQYLCEGLRRGGGVLVIVTAEHRENFSRELDRLGVGIESAIHEKRLVFLDANETLSRFMVAGQPDWNRFEAVLSEAMHEMRPPEGEAGLRAYGEMVDVLWKARQFAAAIRLEQFWNKLLARSSFSLYCAYAIDIFNKEFHLGALDALLCAHTHLVPGETNGNLEAAINLAMDEILGPEADRLRVLIKENNRSSWAVMPNGERVILWLRKNLPDQAEQIVARARGYYQRLILQSAPALANDDDERVALLPAIS
ncbi:MAG TPA: MEDS domain-containing protein [Bryobacteraceae bacterium]|jgi:hypothetical protein|nr:MEDS domain-containing protein [Bryobacteraceae bacterium]